LFGVYLGCGGFYKPAGQLVTSGECRVPRAVAEPRCVARHCAVRSPRVELNNPKTPKTATPG
jgi:hypothetical protein